MEAFVIQSVANFMTSFSDCGVSHVLGLISGYSPLSAEPPPPNGLPKRILLPLLRLRGFSEHVSTPLISVIIPLDVKFEYVFFNTLGYFSLSSDIELTPKEYFHYLRHVLH